MTTLDSTSQHDSDVHQIFHCMDCGDGTQASPLWLTDVSARGARLMGRNLADMPDNFLLRVKGHENGLWRCQIIWRTENEIGITIANSDERER